MRTKPQVRNPKHRARLIRTLRSVIPIMESEPNRKMHYYWAIDGAKKDGKITDANDVLLQHHMSRLLNV